MTASPWMTYLVWPLVKFLCAFTFAALVVVAMNYIERRMLGFFQARQGPNRVGPKGILQTIVDPVKFLLKEDIVPSQAEKVAYYLAPMLVIIPGFTVLCLIPFGPPPTFLAAHVNVGLLLILALTSTTVYGLILGGWASNNKFSLMGGLRSAAQMISYEVPFGLSIVGVLMLAGSLDITKIVHYQEQGVWFFIPQIVTCFIFFVAMVAENNRVPFDLPEAESELVAGFHTEYSAMKFAFFMMNEYVSMQVNSALLVSLFFGGWTLSMGGYGITTAVLRSWGVWGLIAGLAIFVAKVFAVIMVFVWFRATFPRFRFDQLMDLGWKFLIPLALANIFVTGIIVLAGGEWLLSLIGGILILVTAVLVFRGPAKPQRQVINVRRASEA